MLEHTIDICKETSTEPLELRDNFSDKNCDTSFAKHKLSKFNVFQNKRVSLGEVYQWCKTKYLRLEKWKKIIFFVQKRKTFLSYNTNHSSGAVIFETFHVKINEDFSKCSEKLNTLS